MSIEITCPQGHHLKVKDTMAGKAGLCPFCKSRVEVPNPQVALSEDDILDFMGPAKTAETQVNLYSEFEETKIYSNKPQAPPKKVCTKCYREIPAAMHICPYCRTYIASVSDIKIKQ